MLAELRGTEKAERSVAWKECLSAVHLVVLWADGLGNWRAVHSGILKGDWRVA